MVSRFQAVPLVASPSYSNSIAWSHDNLLAVASGHLVTILNPAMPSGPKGLITIPSAKPFPIGVIHRNDLLSPCMLPTCLSRDVRPCVRSISWSPLGFAPNAGCLLAVCTTEGVVKIYRSPFREMSSEWIQVMDVSEMLHTYFAKVRYAEPNFLSTVDCEASRIGVQQEQNGDYDYQPMEDIQILNKGKKQKLQDNHNPPLISAQQYASRSAMVSSIVVAWSPMIQSNSSRSCCSILAIGSKSGKISFWRVHQPQCYSITQQSKPPVATLIKVLHAHNSWITAISWSKFSSDGSPQLLLSTGCSDGSVKVWRVYINDLLKSTEDAHASFSLLKEVINGWSAPTSALSLIVPETSPDKIILAIGKGSGSLEVWINDTSIDKFQVFGPLYDHDQIVTGLAWAYDGRCLYSCSQDNTLHSWILDGNSILEVPLPSNILGTKISSDVPNVSDACFGIAVSPANLVVSVVRSFDVNLLNPMYQARSLKAAVEFFWIGGQKLQKDQESDDENFPGSPNMDLVNWGHNILWSLNQYEHLKKPLVVWDIISALSDFKKSEPNYVEQMLVKWLILNLGFEWGPSLGIVLQQVYGCLSYLTSRQLHLINLISRHVVLNEAKLTNTNGESDKEEPKLWVKLLEMSEKELRERLIGCSFSATINGCNGNWQAVGLAQMRQWVANNDCKDYVKLLASEVPKIEKRCVAEEECSYCSAPVVFQDTEVSYCRADKCSKQGATQKHKLERCAVSMTVCPLTPSWFCVSCNSAKAFISLLERGLIGGALVLAVVLVVFLFVYTLSKKERAAKKYIVVKKQVHQETSTQLITFHGDLPYPSSEIIEKLESLDDEHVVGAGGFGTVYRMVMNDCGTFAVKRIDRSRENQDQAFEQELEVLGSVKHINLVNLRGYCRFPDSKLLIYDYVSNGSLENFLHEAQDEDKTLSWNARLKVAYGSARGLAYLHHDCSSRIIHRDIKSSNILLDDNLEPCVSDFGLAKLLVDEEAHVTTVVAGTFGYLAPEYLQSGRATVKSDVYSFGVLLLELVTGKRPTDPAFVKRGLNVVGWLNTLRKENQLEDVVDTRCTDADASTVEAILEIAGRCTDANPEDRPSMQQVLQFLEQEVMSPCPSDFYDSHSDYA